jgi:hypothetical protein
MIRRCLASNALVLSLVVGSAIRQKVHIVAFLQQ